jgi:hypothetical protein
MVLAYVAAARRLATALLMALLLVGCSNGGNGSTPADAVTVDSGDSTPPTLQLSAAETGGGNPQVDIKPGDPAKTLQLRTKTESINLIATARDDESGVQRLQIWVGKRTLTCSGGTCSPAGPGLQGAPRFQSTEPKQPAGAVVSRQKTLLAALVLRDEIPQTPPAPGTSRTVEIMISARAANHVDGEARTPNITARWTE